jgi:hypothetical protein
MVVVFSALPVAEIDKASRTLRLLSFPIIRAFCRGVAGISAAEAANLFEDLTAYRRGTINKMSSNYR